MAEIYGDLLAGLAVEPRVIECDQMTAELLEEPRKLRKGDEAAVKPKNWPD